MKVSGSGCGGCGRLGGHEGGEGVGVRGDWVEFEVARVHEGVSASKGRSQGRQGKRVMGTRLIKKYSMDGQGVIKRGEVGRH